MPTRTEILEGFRAKIADGRPIIGGGAGTGLSAKCSQEAGLDFIVVYNGVQNYPTVCLFDGIIRANLEETGLGFYKEVELIRLAHERELFTASYVANLDEAAAMAAAGADVIVPHMGLTTAGMIGAQTALTIEECKVKIAELRDAARAENPDVIVICHGGPIYGPDEAAEIIGSVPGIQGFLGASSMERLPTEVAMVEHMRSFTRIPLAR